MFKKQGLKDILAPSLAAIGLGFLISPWLMKSLYSNILVAIGLGLLFLAWLVANLLQKQKLKNENRWQDQKKVMLAMSLCVSLGMIMLAYYEWQMPKYKVAITNKELYRVPPQLNKKELRVLGADCNTYGNTLCSHDVFAKIVKIDSRDYFALANLAMAQSHLGFHKFAVINFQRAIAHGIKGYDVYKFYGHSLLATQQPQKAIQAYQLSLEKNPRQESLRQKIQELAQQ